MDALVGQDIGKAIPEHLAELLEWEIISGGLAPSSRLTEEEVATTYGVSRSPVREGLRLLERDGLVRRSARRGIWVASLSLADFDEVYECRIALEALAAENAARSPDAAQADATFKALLLKLEEAHSQGDIPALFRADVEASKLIYHLTGNLTLQRLLTSLEKQALRYRYFAYAQSPKVVAMSLDGSRRIWSHICLGEAEHAQNLTSALIREIWLTMRPTIAAAFPETA
jgi:DNA-binding GntR family transcriptional regulator